MNSKDTNNLMQSIQDYYRLNAYVIMMISIYFTVDIVFYFLDMHLMMSKSWTFCLLAGVVFFFVKFRPLVKTLKQSRVSLFHEPDGYLREVASKSYKLTYTFVLLFVGLSSVMKVKLPIWVFSEIILALMSLVFGASYLYLSYEKDEEDTEESK